MAWVKTLEFSSTWNQWWEMILLTKSVRAFDKLYDILVEDLKNVGCGTIYHKGRRVYTVTLEVIEIAWALASSGSGGTGWHRVLSQPCRIPHIHHW